MERASFNPETISLPDRFEDEVPAVDFFPNNELAFLNIPFRLPDESFCANNEMEASTKENDVIIFFIGIVLNLIPNV